MPEQARRPTFGYPSGLTWAVELIQPGATDPDTGEALRAGWIVTGTPVDDPDGGAAVWLAVAHGVDPNGLDITRHAALQVAAVLDGNGPAAGQRLRRLQRALQTCRRHLAEARLREKLLLRQITELTVERDTLVDVVEQAGICPGEEPR